MIKGVVMTIKGEMEKMAGHALRRVDLFIIAIVWLVNPLTC